MDAMDKVCLRAEERLELEEHVMDDARHVVLVLWWEHAPRPVPGRECRQSVRGLARSESSQNVDALTLNDASAEHIKYILSKMQTNKQPHGWGVQVNTRFIVGLLANCGPFGRGSCGWPRFPPPTSTARHTTSCTVTWGNASKYLA